MSRAEPTIEPTTNPEPVIFASAWGLPDQPAPPYRGVLIRGVRGKVRTYTMLAECPHRHRFARQALACADRMVRAAARAELPLHDRVGEGL
jgi:hypothetical protein